MSAATNSVANPTPLPSPLVFSPDHHKHLIPLLLPVHVGCITQDHTLAFFLPPLSSTRLLSYWQSQTAKVAEGSQAIIVQQATNEAGEEELAGVVVLSYANPVAETGPFRGEVEKLLVSPRYRRRGVARRLMAKLEEVAKEEGRTLLMLGTEIGSPAEKVYPRLGYTQYGVIPGFGISPKDGSLKDHVFFYKNLVKTEPLALSHDGQTKSNTK